MTTVLPPPPKGLATAGTVVPSPVPEKETTPVTTVLPRPKGSTTAGTVVPSPVTEKKAAPVTTVLALTEGTATVDEGQQGCRTLMALINCEYHSTARLPLA